MDPNGNGKKDVRPLLRELIRRQRQDSDMNPFKTSTNPTKSPNKKNHPTSSSGTTTGEVLTSTKRQVRKPFHQICLEELSRKSKLSIRIEPDDTQTSPTTGSKPIDVLHDKSPKSSGPSTISKKIAAKIQQFEAQASAAQKSSFRQAIPKLPFESKLPLCLKGVDPCVCIPRCDETGFKFPVSTKITKTSLRSSSNSPPLRRKVSTVRKVFENTSTPSSPNAHSPTPHETVTMTKVKDIIKQLVELTEPYAEKIASYRQRDKGVPKLDQRNNDTAQVEELCESFKSLVISPVTSKSSVSDKQQFPDTWKPISLSDVYKKANFGPNSVSLVVNSTSSLTPKSSEEPLPLSELYRKANLPCDDQTRSFKTKHLKKMSLSTSSLDLPETKHSKRTSLISLPDVYSDIQTVAPHSSSNPVQSHDVMDDSRPLSIGEIYEQVKISSSTSPVTHKTEITLQTEETATNRSTGSSQETGLKSDKAGLADFSVTQPSCQMDFLEFGYSVSFPAPSSQNIELAAPFDHNNELFHTEKEYYPMLESAANYIDLSSYVTSQPESIRSACPELNITYSRKKSSSSSSLLAPSSSDDFRSAGILDLTSYCLSDGDKKISSPSKKSHGAIPKNIQKCETEKTKTYKHSEQRPSTSKSTPEIPKHLRDMFEKLGAIPKKALESNIASRPAIKKSKPPKVTSKFQSKKLKSQPLERIPENEEVSSYKSKSLIEQKISVSSKKKKRSSKVPRNTASKNKTPSMNGDIPGGSKHYPVLPDYRPKSVVAKLPLEVACSLSAVPRADTDTLRLKAGGSKPILNNGQCSSTSTGPQTLPEPPGSKSWEGSSSNSLLKYTFRSPQSGAVYAVEEYGEEEDLPDISLLDDGKSATRPPKNNDDGLDIIFGPLEDDYYDCGDYHGDEDDCFEDTECDMGQGGGADYPDLDFLYDDADTHGNEIAELYSYTEQPELQLNVKAFEDQMEIYQLPPSWQRLSVEKQRSVVMKLLDQLECSKKPVRMRSARCLLYIAQGCWAEVQSDTEQQHWTRLNALMLFQLGAFSAFTDLLNMEIDNNTAAHVAMRKIAISLIDSQDLRVILSVLYIITEVIRIEQMREDSEYKCEIEAFVFEIGHAHGDDHLVIKLLSMVTRFCSGAAPHFPMKKVLLLLWKVILVSLGGMNTLKELKAEKRRRAKLPPQDEDTMEIAKTMRSSSPPASASDLLEAQNQKRSTRPFRRSLMKQSSLDDQESLGMEMETSMGNENGDELADMTEYDERRPTDNSEAGQMFNNHILNMYNMQVSPPPQHDIVSRGLPWKPKVRQKDIDAFLDASRQKFLGYSLPGDQTTLFGLPEPIHEGVRILKEHVYTSLAELQIQKEEEIARNPVSTKEEEIELTPAEILYQAMLPNLPQYMIALLKILLAAAPTSKAKTDSINIMSDVLPEEMPMTVLQSMKLGIDVNRHKEIIVKAVSAILLLLLKHFKLNHIYQFEFMSQHLVFANCIPLVLKFFNQNIMGYIGAKNVIPILDFPSCVIGDQPELTAEGLEIGDAAPFSWRNVFSCINLLRILNKLTKWKHSRIMMLVVFKSAPILKRTLKIRHAMTQLYVLKLLKMQTKYLGRQWRKSNMKTISAIYQKVRHRLNDDWAYGNDLDARPWDFQAEECALRASVDRFNNRRYTQVVDSDFKPVDNNPSSVLGQPYELSESFKRHYSLWLEQEVHGTPVDWEQLLLSSGKEDKLDDKDRNKQ